MKVITLGIVLALCAFTSTTANDFKRTYATTSNEFVYNCLQEERNKSLHSVYNIQLNVELLTTNHVLDQLITRIFAIILRDIFDIHNVTIISYQLRQNQSCSSHRDRVDHLFNLMEYEAETPNLIIIHLNSWISTLATALIPAAVTELGPISTPGRYGWFVPKLGMFNGNHIRNGEIKLESDIFIDPNNTYYELFALNADAMELLEKYGDIEYKYNDPKCANRECVTLLAEHYCDSNFIEKQIQESGSYLNVLWLGQFFRPKLNDLILHYEKYDLFKSRTFIVLHWTPSDIINSKIKYLQIHLPRCEDMYPLIKSHCKYELTPILKYATRPTQCNSENQIFGMLRQFTINDKSLESLLEIKFNDKYSDHDEIACKWLKNNSIIYENWIDNNATITLYIGGMFPFGRHDHHNLAEVAQRAIDAINKNTTILPGYKLVLYVNNCQCRADLVMKYFLQYYKVQNLLGVLGPACSETVDPIASLSKHTEMAIISYSAEGLNFSNRNEYPNIFRTIGSNYQYINVYMSIMEKFGWTRIAALTEEGSKSTEYISYMESEMINRNYKLIENIKLISDISATEIKRFLMDLKKKRTKIIIADISNQNLINMILCESQELKMTSHDGYVWFLPHWFLPQRMSKNLTSNINCSYDELKRAIEGYFSIMHTAFGEEQSIMQEGISIGDWLTDFYGSNYNLMDISNYTGFVYDAVWTYALSANILLKAGRRTLDILGNKRMVEHLVKLVWKTDFQGLSGRVRFAPDGSRITTISMVQWINQKFVKVGIFEPKIIIGNSTQSLTRGGNLKLMEKSIKWLWKKNQQPNDGSQDCILGELLNMNCETVDLFFSPTICAIFTIITFSLSYFFWKRKYQRKFQSSVKIMKNFGIDFSDLQYKKLTSLNKWEIAKDKIVVNRRLGAGAFGTVYGGEAFFDDKGWIAVAIKTLKVGASVEDRLDFLSEADAMKCLDHENIIKMLGVCLQSEPIYTVMEYMLYGDLKTYLLSRRNMVNESDFDENSDVSPKQLTTYALHIVKGLEYLANQKYIHRDIACRNCLINAQRIVKLADFGMTKVIVESDYYRFSHKRMLPVRWMAPESLHLGLFTAASDVWSYGIVLYEIITFGSLPYKGYTNKQVFQYVFKGNSIKLPLGIKQQLSSLILACLSQESDKRPTASDIISYISNYPRLLTPCLDFSASSIELTDADKMEMVPDTQSVLTTTCYSDSYMSQSIPMKTYDPESIFTGKELNAFKPMKEDNDNNENKNDNDKCKPLPPISFALTPEDGYSIMCPLLKSPTDHVTKSPQLSLHTNFTQNH